MSPAGRGSFKDIEMPASAPCACAAPRNLVTYVTCTAPQAFVIDATLSSEEREWLDRIFGRLADIGAVTLCDVAATPLSASTLDDVLEHLRATVSPLVLDAAVGAAAFPASPPDRPQALVPLTGFAPATPRGIALTAYGQLFGSIVELEAFHVRGDDDPVAEPPAPRFERWCEGATCSGEIGTVRLPGAQGAYAVFGTVRQS